MAAMKRPEELARDEGSAVRTGGRLADEGYVRRVQPGTVAGYNTAQEERRRCPPLITVVLGALFAFYAILNLYEGYSMYTFGFSGEEFNLTFLELKYEAALYTVLTVLFAVQGGLCLLASFVLLFLPSQLVMVSLVASAGGLICTGANGLSNIQYPTSAFTLAFYLILFSSLCLEPIRVFLKGELLCELREAGENGEKKDAKVQ